MKKGKETRRHERVSAEYEYFMTFGGHTYSGNTREISPFGAGVGAEVCPEIGQEVDLSVFMPKSAFKILTKGVVRSCVENPKSTGESDKYIVGIEFTETKEDGSPLIDQKKGATFSPSHTITIDAPADKCFKAAFDFERFTEWSSNLEKVKVLKKYPDGRGRLIEFHYDFFIRKAHYVLEYSYNDNELIASWIKAGGDKDVTEINGFFAFSSRGENQASTTYEIDLALNFVPSKRLINWGTSILMRKELKNFKNFVEKVL